MPEIELTRGYVATVDPVDYDWAIGMSWQALVRPRSNKVYATTGSVYENGKQVNLSMHRLIVERRDGTLGRKHVHHVNGDGLDNRRKNLEVATSRRHHRLHAKNIYSMTSPYRGVVCTGGWSGDPLDRTWRTFVNFPWGIYTVCGFRTAEEAAQEADRLICVHIPDPAERGELNNLSDAVVAQAIERYEEDLRRHNEGCEWFRQQFIVKRQSSGLSQVELADLLGIKYENQDGHRSCSTISAWERGRRALPEKYVDRAREILGIGYMEETETADG